MDSNPFRDLSDASDKVIAYHREYAAIAGCAVGGIFLSQAVYWAKRTKDPDGWFFKTQKEWFEETYLTRREQEKARRALRELGILEEQRKGQPAKLWFRINGTTLRKYRFGLDCTNPAILETEVQTIQNAVSRMNQGFAPDCQNAPFLNVRCVQTENEHAQNVQSSLADPYNLVCTDPPNTPIYTEIKTESTSRDLKNSLSLLSDLPEEREFENVNEKENAAVGSDPEEDAPPPQPEWEANHNQGKTVDSKPSGQDQFSAAGEVPLEQKTLPPWRNSWGPQDFVPGYVDHVWRWMRKNYGDRTRADAIARIDNAERSQKMVQLHEDFATWQSEESRPSLTTQVERAAIADQESLRRLSGNPAEQQACMQAGMPTTSPSDEPSGVFDKAIADLQRGDCSEALTQLQGYLVLLRSKFPNFVSQLKGEGILPQDFPTSLNHLDEAQLLEVLQQAHSIWNAKISRREPP